jgi:hypothetical protein
VAEASSSVDGFALGTTLRLGRISTLARLTVRPGSPPVKETSVSVASVTIAGQTVGLTEKGLVAADQTVAPVDATALNEALSKAGIELRYVPAVETPSSVTSASLRVGWTTDVPGRGPVRTTMTLGQVRVSAEAEPVPGPSLPDITAPAADSASTMPAATLAAPGDEAAEAATAGDREPLGSGAVESGQPAVPAPTSPSATPLTEPDQLAVAARQPAIGETVAPVVAALPTADTAGLYLALLAAGLVAVGLSRLMGRLAVTPSPHRFR